MITLITGQPGAGKTLYALNFVKDRAEKENRPVYFSGINDLKLPWLELDSGEDWHKVPSGSIVILDECQRVFRPRAQGSSVPEYVSKLETHRHDGIDLVLVTQHPMLADNNVRRLVGQHFHVVRAFGTKKATVHEWGEVKTDCDKRRSDSIRHDFFYPRKSFDWYKSAELHTHKARIPLRVFFLFALPLILGGIIWAAVHYFRTPGTTPLPASITGVQAGTVPSAVPAAVKVKTVAQYLDERSPRIAGLAYTAPVYDDATRPTDAPFPAACMAFKSRCSCFSQQATVLDVPGAVCRQIVARGYFKDWDSKPKSERQTVALAPSIDRRAKPEDVDRPALVIPPPVHVPLSDGFSAPRPGIDKGSAVKPPGGLPSASPGAPGSGIGGKGGA
jgi:hypothetical protein